MSLGWSQMIQLTPWNDTAFNWEHILKNIFNVLVFNVLGDNFLPHTLLLNSSLPQKINKIKNWITCVCASTPLHLHCVIMGMFRVSPSHLCSGQCFGNQKQPHAYTVHPSQVSATNPTGSCQLPSVSYCTFTLPQKTMQTKVPYCFSSGRRKTHKPQVQVSCDMLTHTYTCLWNL